MSTFHQNPIPEVTVDVARSGSAEHVFLDVRNADEWDAGPAPGALWMPLGELERARMELPINRPVHCICRSGARSARAAEALIGVDVREARARLTAGVERTRRDATRAIATRGRRLAQLAGAPERSVRGERAKLHQQLREIRAASNRGVAARGDLARTHALVLSRKAGAAVGSSGEAARGMQAYEAAVAAHDPQRTLERGYALVESRAGDPLTTAAAAREEGEVRVRFADDAVRARIEDEADGN